MGEAIVASSVAQYAVDDETVVRFEFDPPPGFRAAGAAEIAGQVRETLAPTAQAARVVLDKVREARPDEVKLKFGIKISGGANWLMAKMPTEANFEYRDERGECRESSRRSSARVIRMRLLFVDPMPTTILRTRKLSTTCSARAASSLSICLA